VPEEADWQRSARLAADALAEAKADARARGDHPATGGRTRQPRAAGGSPVPGGSPGEPGEPGGPGQGDGPAGAGRAAPGGPRRRRGGRARREDPQPLSTAFDGLLADQGWRTAAAVGSVFGRWDQLVGPDVAAHTRPERFSDGELVVIADSSAWATQVRLLTSAVLRRLNEELGHGTVTRVVVRGPAPPRRMGPLRVRGSREHTGDYG
jgi:predicted nucleic acid-binding Zn ribbon protein